MAADALAGGKRSVMADKLMATRVTSRDAMWRYILAALREKGGA
jgi:hypothetical protein